MKPSDAGSDASDATLRKIQREVDKIYAEAAKGAQTKLDAYLKGFEKRDIKKRALVEAGQLSQAEYTKWRRNQMLTRERYRDLTNVLAEDLSNADKLAKNIVSGHLPDVYADNVNYGTYQVEAIGRVDTSFALYDRNTVERLIRENPKLYPDPAKGGKTALMLAENKDLRWNKLHIRNEILQGVLQGESVRDISKRMRKVAAMDKVAAMRTARTAVTGVQNAGRIDAYSRAKEMGIDVKQEWLAAHDGKTRDSHAEMDGEQVEIGHKFSNGCAFPGDPGGAPEEVYNCRCTLIPALGVLGQIKGRDNYQASEYEQEWAAYHKDDTASKMSFAEWKDARVEQSTIVDGKDISETWTRRADMFDFEIEDVINAQGFDGLPRVVSAEEFDEVVKAANGGKGFIAQRTYSAPNQETLDAYRDQLYHGKWYVDCSTGGSQYGQGMYCAADYTGELSDGIKHEMRHYQELNNSRFGKERTNEERLSLALKEAENRGVKLTKDAREYLEASYTGNFALMGKAEKNLTKDVISTLDDIYIPLKAAAPSFVETLTLDRSAKIIKYSDLDNMKNYGYLEKHILSLEKNISDTDRAILRQWIEDEDYVSALPKHLQKIGNKLESRADVLMNLNHGSLAATLGYDAINAEGHGQSGSYTVILNRTKVIIRRP